jgi:hypothetical protein
MISLCFHQNAAQKVDIFWNFFSMRLKDRFGLATPALGSYLGIFSLEQN